MNSTRIFGVSAALIALSTGSAFSQESVRGSETNAMGDVFSIIAGSSKLHRKTPNLPSGHSSNDGRLMAPFDAQGYLKDSFEAGLALQLAANRLPDWLGQKPTLGLRYNKSATSFLPVANSQVPADRHYVWGGGPHVRQRVGLPSAC